MRLQFTQRPGGYDVQAIDNGQLSSRVQFISAAGPGTFVRDWGTGSQTFQFLDANTIQLIGRGPAVISDVLRRE